jgi:hypothetical protein
MVTVGPLEWFYVTTGYNGVMVREIGIFNRTLLQNVLEMFSLAHKNIC